jgi:hypothetical protein
MNNVTTTSLETEMIAPTPQKEVVVKPDGGVCAVPTPAESNATQSGG